MEAADGGCRVDLWTICGPGQQRWQRNWHIAGEKETSEVAVFAGSAYSDVLGVKGSQVQILSSRRSK
jgi:hypothetical protein